MHIMKYLQVGSLLKLSTVNKDFHSFARQPVLWRRLYVKDFGRKFLTSALCSRVCEPPGYWRGVFFPPH